MEAIIMDLPERVRGFVVRSFDADYGDDVDTVVLNARLNLEQQEKTYLHESQHIQYHDFDSGLSADQIESIAHNRMLYSK